jgi:hypothetical protein
MSETIDKGWLKLHRKMLDSIVFQDSKLFHVWCYCLIKANHTDRPKMFNGQKVLVKRGQFIWGRNKASEELHMPSSTAERKLKLLEDMGKVSRKVNRRFTLLTVCKYNTYQSKDVQDEQLMNNPRTSDEQVMNTNKNVKNDNNEKKELGESDKKRFVIPNQLYTIQECISAAEYEGYKKEEGEKFFHYYNAQGWKRGGSGLVITDLVSAFRSWIIKGEQNKQPIAKETWEERHLKKLNS